MADVTSTSFGMIIAYILPGFTALYSASFWSPKVQHLFDQFVTGESNGGRFLLVILVSLIVGLELSIVRWAVFEKWICRKECLTPDDFIGLRKEEQLTAFRAAVDEQYRYHQFFGGMTFAIPVYLVGYIRTSICSWGTVLLAFGLFLLWALTAVAAKVGWSNYVTRSRSILKEATHA